MTARKKTDKSDEKEVSQVNVKGIPELVLQKLQIIAGLEGVSNNDVYKQAFETYVGLYEKKHGKIKLKEKGSGLDVI